MVFVTGGSGLVGAALLRQLVARGIYVRALRHRHFPLPLTEEEIRQVEWIDGDILDVVLLENAVEDCSAVFHCAAVVSFHPSRRQEMYRLNVEGTANVVNACLSASAPKLLHVSSVAALGRLRNGETISETAQWSQEAGGSYYGQTKHLAEMEVWRGIGEGLTASIINPSIILGEASWNTGSSAIFKKAWNDFPWYTDGSTGFVDVNDVAQLLIHLMNSTISGERFIVCNEHCSYKELLTGIANEFGKKPPRHKAPVWMMQLLWRVEALKSMFLSNEPLLTKETVATAQTTTRYNTSKIRATFPDFQFTPLPETITRVCNWYRTYYQLPA
jgi:dihydroflavonol-4-reductase